MRDRTLFKKNTKGQYDPQVGAAAAANTALAERAQSWTEDFYEKHIVPTLESAIRANEENIRQQGQLFDVNMGQVKLQDERYRSRGIPAEDRYYDMVSRFSSPEEQERQATAAIGDVRTAEATNIAQLQRKLQGMGINPSSPAAVSALSDRSVQTAATQAAAATRAREAAKALGMSLTADAANFGRGTTSVIAQAGAGASGNSSNAAQVAQGATGSASGASAPMQGAFQIAQRAYGSNLDAYTSMNKASIEAKGQAAAGMGQLLGFGANLAFGGPTGFLR
jgi:hypothetical protein